MNDYSFIFFYVIIIFMQFMPIISQSTSTTTTTSTNAAKAYIVPYISNDILYIIIGCVSFLIILIICVAILCCYWSKQSRKANESLVTLQNVTTVSNTSENGKNDSDKNVTDTTNYQKPYVSPSVTTTENKIITVQSDNISTTNTQIKQSETTETTENNSKQTLNIPATTSNKPRSSGITRNFVAFLNYMNKDAPAALKTAQTLNVKKGTKNNNTNYAEQNRNNMVVNTHNAPPNAVTYQNMHLQRQPVTQSAPHFNMQPHSPHSPHSPYSPQNNQFTAAQMQNMHIQRQAMPQSSPHFNMQQSHSPHSPPNNNGQISFQQMQNMYVQRQIMCKSAPNFNMQQHQNVNVQNGQSQMQTNVYGQPLSVNNSVEMRAASVTVPNNVYGQQIQSGQKHGMIPEEKEDDKSVGNDTDSFDVETEDEENSEETNSEESDSNSDESESDSEESNSELSESISNGTVNIIDVSEDTDVSKSVEDVDAIDDVDKFHD